MLMQGIMKHTTYRQSVMIYAFIVILTKVYIQHTTYISSVILLIIFLTGNLNLTIKPNWNREIRRIYKKVRMCSSWSKYTGPYQKTDWKINIYIIYIGYILIILIMNSMYNTEFEIERAWQYI